MSHNLFQPVKIGRHTLQHRVVVPPLTRNRANQNHAVDDETVEHYARRAAVPGTFIITEATFVARRNAGVSDWPTTPGIWSKEQISAWKKVVDAVHARGSVIFLQIWAVGRHNDPAVLKARNVLDHYISASDVPVDGVGTPRPITRDEIQEYVRDFGAAAAAAVNEAGFDGIEAHAGGGYLLDEFFKGATNLRHDEYGGSVENRSRFYLQFLDAVVGAVGADRVGMKLSPWTLATPNFDEYSGKPGQEDPEPLYSYLVREARRRYPDLAYLQVVEPSQHLGNTRSNDFLREIWRGKPYISVGGYSRESAIDRADKNNHELIAFGRPYTSNPDLPIRLEHNIPLTPYDRDTFYFDAGSEPSGYNSFGYATESKKILAARGVHIDPF